MKAEDKELLFCGIIIAMVLLTFLGIAAAPFIVAHFMR